MIFLWNSLYLDRAVADLRERGLEITRADVERLSPLGSDHIHLQGHYPFTLAEYILQGDFLPLREIEAQEWEEVEQPMHT